MHANKRKCSKDQVLGMQIITSTCRQIVNLIFKAKTDSKTFLEMARQGFSLREVVIAAGDAPPLGLGLTSSYEGVQSNAVVPGSAADLAGIEVGDVLIGINGKDISKAGLDEATASLKDALEEAGASTNLIFARPPAGGGSANGSRRSSTEAASPTTPVGASSGGQEHHRSVASPSALSSSNFSTGAVSPVMEIFADGLSPGSSVIHDISAITMAEVRANLHPSTSPSHRSGPDGQVIKTKYNSPESVSQIVAHPTGPLEGERLLEVTL